jgi:two-component system response regulator YesN
MATLVIIDDEKIVVEWIKTMLERSGEEYQIVGTAYNGIRGVAVVRQMKPDIVVTDIRIPGLDGLSLIEHTMEELPETGYIVMSGYRDFSYARKALQLRVLDYVDKPITEDKLFAALATAKNFVEEKKRLSLSKARSETEDYNQICQQMTENLIQYLKEESGEDVMEYLGQALLNMEKTGIGLERFQDECVKNIYVAVEVIRERNPQFEFRKNIVPYAEIKQLRTMEEIRIYMLEIFREFSEALKAAENLFQNKKIYNLIQYINDHYTEDIGLTELAEYAKTNPAYLSMLFKEQVGVSYIKYLTKIRIGKAKELLRSGEKASDVSEKVGYRDYRYFSQVFKKSENMTPNQYRERFVES